MKKGELLNFHVELKKNPKFQTFATDISSRQIQLFSQPHRKLRFSLKSFKNFQDSQPTNRIPRPFVAIIFQNPKD